MFSCLYTYFHLLAFIENTWILKDYIVRKSFSFDFVASLCITIWFWFYFWLTMTAYRRSQWPRCLRRESVASRLLGFWVRIPPEAWTCVSCEWCVFSGRDLCVRLITRQEKSYRVWCVWVIVKPRKGRPWPIRGCCTMKIWQLIAYSWSSVLQIPFLFTYRCSPTSAPVGLYKHLTSNFGSVNRHIFSKFHPCLWSCVPQIPPVFRHVVSKFHPRVRTCVHNILPPFKKSAFAIPLVCGYAFFKFSPSLHIWVLKFRPFTDVYSKFISNL
jgi:hypothetical protein